MRGKGDSDISPPLSLRHERQRAKEHEVRWPEGRKDPIGQGPDLERGDGAEIIGDADKDKLADAFELVRGGL